MHDEMTMPGLNGTDTTETEVADLRTIFQQHMEIERRVTNLSNGISTFTASQNPAGPGGDRLACIDDGHPIGGGQKPRGDHPIPDARCAF